MRYRLAATKVALMLWCGWIAAPLSSALAEESPARESQGVAENLILLGQSAPLNGPAAELGREFRRGAVLYFDQINLQGGVHGRNLFLISRDDGYEPERTAANTRQLLEQDRVFALFGYIGTPTTLAALPVAEPQRAPLFAPFTGAETLRTPLHPLVYNVRASYFQEAEALVEQVSKQGLNNVAVLYQDDTFGQTGLKGVQQALDRRKMKLGATGLVARNTTDVTNALNSIKATQPDAVIMVTSYAPAAEFVRKAKEAGLDSPFFALSFTGSKALAADLWLDSLGVTVSQVVPFPGDESVPVVAEYVAALRLATPEAAISYVSLEGYIAAKALVQGLERAGPELTRRGLLQALDSLGELDLGGFRLGWSPTNHSGSDFVDLTVIGEHGRWLY